MKNRYWLIAIQLFTILVSVAVVPIIVTACSESSVASRNISTGAHNFEVRRRCIFYNGITGEYILTIDGMLTVTESDTQDRLEVTVKTGPNNYKKHYLGLSDNVTYFVEQLEPTETDPYHYRVVFRPSTIVPDVEIDKR